MEAIETMKSTQVKLDEMELVVNDVLKKNGLAQTALVCEERKQRIIDILHERNLHARFSFLQSHLFYFHHSANIYVGKVTLFFECNRDNFSNCYVFYL